MKTPVLLSLALLPPALVSCSTSNITVGLDNARFQNGYLNSKLISPGTLLLVDPSAADDKKLTLLPPPDTSNNTLVSGPGGTELVSSASSGLAISGAIPAGGVPADVQASIAKQTSVTIKQFVSSRFADPEFVLNEADYAQHRLELGQQFAGNSKVRFLFIAGATKADEVHISSGTPDGKDNGLVVNVGGKAYKITFTSAKEASWQGQKEPVFIQPRLYTLVRESSPGGTGYRFAEDRTSRIDITGALNNASTF